MELKNIRQKFRNSLIKHKYAIIVLLVGIILMTFPSFEKKSPQPEADVEPVKKLTTEEKLSVILSKISGVGAVEVLLTSVTGEEIIYQTNGEETSDQQMHKVNTDTVTVTDKERNQTGLVRQINPPVYLGVVVVCQGADNPTVQLAVVDAVSKATGLGANKISVLKMN